MESLIYGSFIGLSLVAFGTRQLAKKSEKEKQSVSNINFLSFQKSFFSVYFLALLGDWLQGPYVYKLYAFYNFKESDIAILYVAGFASSVLFGTCTGPLADLWGRKKMAMAFAFIYVFCCLTKLSPNFWWLMVGRIFGGIATSMLFSTFESWYVYEHSEHHGFPPEWIGVTFSITTFYNGVLAIGAGVLANVSAETLGYGPVAPFVVALVPLGLCGLLVTKTWDENYGNRKGNFTASCKEGLRIIFGDVNVLLLGTIQSILESCMYIFVFMWTPVLDIPGRAGLPLGMVFACFMICIMIGSSLYTVISSRGCTPEDVLKYCLVMLCTSMGICCFTAGPNPEMLQTIISFGAFLVLEVAIGMYFPVISYLRSQVIPESHRANVMNWFRVPMNCVTCGALLCLHVDAISQDKRIMFGACLLLAFTGWLLCARFIKSFRARVTNKSGSDGEDTSGLLDHEEQP